MSRTKLVSLRIDKETLNDIDEIAKSQRYFNRSFLINHLLKAVLNCTIDKQFWKLINCYDPVSEGFYIHITDRDGKPIS